MFINEINFLDKIEFNENIIPFKKDDEILFGGEKQIQDLITFYKDDKIAKKFKINCILANNGGGKSRFFEVFRKYFIDDSIIPLDEKKDIITIQDENGKNISKNDYEVILDDFFVLSKSKDFSINREILKLGYEGFYLQTYNFLNKQEKLGDIKIFSEFIHADLENEDGYSIEISFPKGFTGNIYPELMEKIIEYIPDEIEQEEFKSFINNIYYYSGFGGTITDNNIYSDIVNIRKLVGKNNNLMLLITTGYLKDIFNKLINPEKIKNYSYFEYCPNLIEDIKKEKKELEDLLNFSNKDKKDKQEIKNAIKKIYDLWENINFTKIYKKGETNFTDTEIRFLSRNFDINLKFKLQKGEKEEYKKFNDLSGGEKCMLSRFTNIYMEIINSTKSNFIILIDEPDLHLHLDWQRQYIQKLVDTFSTINKDIKMHFILATHSPFIVSDLPSESIVLFDKNKSENFTQIKNFDRKKQEPKEKLKNKSFGANYVDLIRDGFFFENQVLMGSFAESNIKNISIAQKFLIIGLDKIKEDCLNEKEKRVYHFLKEGKIEKIENFKKYVDIIGDDFLKNNLLYL